MATLIKPIKRIAQRAPIIHAEPRMSWLATDVAGSSLLIGGLPAVGDRSKISLGQALCNAAASPSKAAREDSRNTLVHRVRHASPRSPMRRANTGTTGNSPGDRIVPSAY